MVVTPQFTQEKGNFGEGCEQREDKLAAAAAPSQVQ
jgi:hypothetical protein